jgi:hypothetical protein
VHALELTDPAPLLDADVQAWLAEAYWLGTAAVGKRVSQTP